MPIHYCDVPIRQLLCNQSAYEIIDATGKKLFENWNMDEFEKWIIRDDYSIFLQPDENKIKLLSELEQLDKTMPFLKFGEEGQHYGYELFLSPPPYWASRGAPFFWCYTARCFTYDKLPLSVEALTDKYMSIVNEFNIPFGKDEYIFIDKFSAGGMSSGMVGGLFAKTALETLIHRVKKY